MLSATGREITTRQRTLTSEERLFLHGTWKIHPVKGSVPLSATLKLPPNLPRHEVIGLTSILQSILPAEDQLTILDGPIISINGDDNLAALFRYGARLLQNEKGNPIYYLSPPDHHAVLPSDQTTDDMRRSAIWNLLRSAGLSPKNEDKTILLEGNDAAYLPFIGRKCSPNDFVACHPEIMSALAGFVFDKTRKGTLVAYADIGGSPSSSLTVYEAELLQIHLNSAGIRAIERRVYLKGQEKTVLEVMGQANVDGLMDQIRRGKDFLAHSKDDIIAHGDWRQTIDTERSEAGYRLLEKDCLPFEEKALLNSLEQKNWHCERYLSSRRYPGWRLSILHLDGLWSLRKAKGSVRESERNPQIIQYIYNPDGLLAPSAAGAPSSNRNDTPAPPSGPGVSTRKPNKGLFR